jgi:hypothetical protein
MVHNGVIQLHHGIHPFPLEYAPPVAKAANLSKTSFRTAPGPKDAIERRAAAIMSIRP